MVKIKSKRTSEVIAEIISNGGLKEKITIGRLIQVLGDRAFGIVVFIFALPNCIPLPGIPGFSTITGFPIVLFGIQMMLGKQLWVPSRIAAYEFPRDQFIKVLTKALPTIKRVEWMLRPRLEWFASKPVERLIGLFFFIFGTILALPIPFANFPLGIAICLLALGLIERDGFVILVGIVVGLCVSILISGTIVMLIETMFKAAHTI